MSLRRDRNTLLAMWTSAAVSSFAFALLDQDAWSTAIFPFVISLGLGAVLTLRR